MRAPSGEKREDFHTVEEFSEILGAIKNDAFRDLVIVSWDTGCRPQESLRVEARHFNAETRTWIFPKSESKTKKQARVVRSKGIELTMESLGGPEGVSKGGAIVIEQSLDALNQFAVLTHELAHELLHRNDRRASTSKTMRETEAESVAFVVCDAFGIQSELHSKDYIQLYGGTPEILSKSLEHIRRAAVEIIDGLKRSQ